MLDHRICSLHISLLVVVSQSADSTAVGTDLSTQYVPGWSTCGTTEPWVPGTMRSKEEKERQSIQPPPFSFDLANV